MMMGPEPMIRILWMSLRLGIPLPLSLAFDHPGKTPKKIIAVMRAGGIFRMVLHGKDRVLLVPESLEGLVIQIDVSQFHVFFAERVDVDHKAVILRGDLDTSRREVH